MTRVRNELSAALGREPVEEEIAEGLGWTVGKVRALSELLADVFSLDRPVGAGDGSTELGEIVEDEQTPGVPEEVIRDLENTRLKESLEGMSARERHVLARRYGLGVTRERVRQLQRNAERRLRGRLASERCRSGTPRPSVGDQRRSPR
jgi:RNA polymerase primary sigma factor